MMKSIVVATAVAGLSLTAGASASAFEDAMPAKPPKAERSCFFGDQINGWRSADNEKTVYLDVGVKDIYRADLMFRCTDLDDAFAIGVDTRGAGNSVCSGMDIELLVRTSIGPQRCVVTKLTKLTPEEVQALKTKKKSK